MTDKKLTIHDMILRRYEEMAYAVFPEVTHDQAGDKRRRQRRIDYLIMSLWKSRGHRLIAIEVKTARGDWLKELKEPQKADAIFQQVHEFWLVATKGVAQLDEIPPDWGFMEAKGNRLYTVKKAPCLNPPPISWALFARMLMGIRDRHKAALGEYVHHSEIEDEIKKAKKDAEYWADRKRERDAGRYEELKESVASFEKVSGVKIDHWNGGHVGEVFRIVHQLGVAGIIGRLESAYKTTNEHRDTLAQTIAQLKSLRDDSR